MKNELFIIMFLCLFEGQKNHSFELKDIMTWWLEWCLIFEKFKFAESRHPLRQDASHISSSILALISHPQNFVQQSVKWER